MKACVENEGTKDRLKDLPPSAKLVYKVLECDGSPSTQKDIVESSLLPARTVRYAIRRLKEQELVDERAYLKDARQSRYELVEN